MTVPSLLLWQVDPARRRRAPRASSPTGCSCCRRCCCCCSSPASPGPTCRARPPAAPASARCFVVDCSASMQAREGPDTRFDLARRAVRDQIGRARRRRRGDAHRRRSAAGGDRCRRPPITPKRCGNWRRSRPPTRAPTSTPRSPPPSAPLRAPIAPPASRCSPTRRSTASRRPGGAASRCSRSARPTTTCRSTASRSTRAASTIRAPRAPSSPSATTPAARATASSPSQLDGAVFGRQGFTIAPRSATGFPVPPLPGAGVLRASLDVDDALAVDNRAYAYVHPQRPVHVLVVSDDRDAAGRAPAHRRRRARPAARGRSRRPRYDDTARRRPDPLPPRRAAGAHATPRASTSRPPTPRGPFPPRGTLDTRADERRRPRPSRRCAACASTCPSRSPAYRCSTRRRGPRRWSARAPTARSCRWCSPAQVNDHRQAVLAFDLASQGLLRADHTDLLLLFLDLIDWLVPAADNVHIVPTGERRRHRRAARAAAPHRRSARRRDDAAGRPDAADRDAAGRRVSRLRRRHRGPHLRQPLRCRGIRHRTARQPPARGRAGGPPRAASGARRRRHLAGRCTPPRRRCCVVEWLTAQTARVMDAPEPRLPLRPPDGARPRRCATRRRCCCSLAVALFVCCGRTRPAASRSRAAQRRVRRAGARARRPRPDDAHADRSPDRGRRRSTPRRASIRPDAPGRSATSTQIQQHLGARRRARRPRVRRPRRAAARARRADDDTRRAAGTGDAGDRRRRGARRRHGAPARRRRPPRAPAHRRQRDARRQRAPHPVAARRRRARRRRRAAARRRSATSASSASSPRRWPASTAPCRCASSRATTARCARRCSTCISTAQIADSSAVELPPGRSAMTLASRLTSEGSHRLRAELRAEGDAQPANNARDVGITLRDPTRALVLTTPTALGRSRPRWRARTYAPTCRRRPPCAASTRCATITSSCSRTSPRPDLAPPTLDVLER